MFRPPPRSTLFPCTTLFRSLAGSGRLERALGRAPDVARDLLEPHRRRQGGAPAERVARSEEHTSELQSRQYLVCRLLLEKKTRESPFLRLALRYPHRCRKST